MKLHLMFFSLAFIVVIESVLVIGVSAQSPRPLSESAARQLQSRIRPIGTSRPTDSVRRGQAGSSIRRTAYLQSDGFAIPDLTVPGIGGDTSDFAQPGVSNPLPSGQPLSNQPLSNQPLSNQPSAPNLSVPPGQDPTRRPPPVSNGLRDNQATVAPGASAPGFSTPGTRGLPAPGQPADRARSFEFGGGSSALGQGGTPLPLRNDFESVPQPQLANPGFANMDNCPNVSPPSSYDAGRAFGCGNIRPVGLTTPGRYIPPPAQIPAPAIMPPIQAGGIPLSGVTPPDLNGVAVPGAAPTAVPAGALVSFGQETYPVQVGQGLWGQPVAYVPGQSVRNWLRYFSF